MSPEYEAKCTQRKLNPVTQLMEPFLPLYSKISRKFTSVVIVLFMVRAIGLFVFYELDHISPKFHEVDSAVKMSMSQYSLLF